MRYRMLFALALPLALIGRAAAEEQDPKAIITKAIAAVGGKDKLEKFKGSKSKGKGTFSADGLDIPFTTDSMMQLPSKLKNTLTLDVMGMSKTIVYKVNGDKGSLT